MSIGWAVAELKAGRRVRRAGWNGKGMYIWLLTGTAGRDAEMLPCVTLRTAQGQFQPGWVCSQADLLAEDWESAEATGDATP